MISAKHLDKTYGNTQVLKDLSLKIAKGNITTIVGDSGAGKTTLLLILGTLEHFDKNENTRLYINDENIAKLSDKQLSKFRNEHIGFIFQFHELLPEFTALENACMPAWIKGDTKKRAEEKALALFDYLGITDRANHKPDALSGGEQQRVAIARALINDPDIVFADEPSASLDTANAEELYRLFIKLKEERGYTFIIATHSKRLGAFSNTKITMKDGEITHIEEQS